MGFWTIYFWNTAKTAKSSVGGSLVALPAWVVRTYQDCWELVVVGLRGGSLMVSQANDKGGGGGQGWSTMKENAKLWLQTSLGRLWQRQ